MTIIDDPQIVTVEAPLKKEIYFDDCKNSISLTSILNAMRSIDPKIFDNDIANIQKKNHEFKYPVLSAEEARKQQHDRK